MRLATQYLVGIGLLLGTTVLLGRYGGEETVPNRESFGSFPIEINQWRGREIGLDKDIAEVLKADDVMMRVYQSPQADSLWLFVGYYKSQRTGATYHSPMNCLPGGGWTIVSREEVPLMLDGRTVPVNRVLIQKGLDQQLIFYWYQDRGRIITSEYWAKGYLIWDAITRHRTDGAIVRVSVPVRQSSEQAFEVGVRFLQQAFPLLRAHLPV